MRITPTTAKVLRAFLVPPRGERYGFGLMRETELQAGSLYPVLRRLERRGWISGRDEAIDEHVAGRPKRRLYVLTDRGVAEATAALTDFYDDLSLPAPDWVRK